MLRRRGNYAVWPEKYEFILYLGKHKNLVIVTTRAKRATVEPQYSVIFRLHANFFRIPKITLNRIIIFLKDYFAYILHT